MYAHIEIHSDRVNKKLNGKKEIHSDRFNKKLNGEKIFISKYEILE